MRALRCTFVCAGALQVFPPLHAGRAGAALTVFLLVLSRLHSFVARVSAAESRSRD